MKEMPWNLIWALNWSFNCLPSPPEKHCFLTKQRRLQSQFLGCWFKQQKKTKNKILKDLFIMNIYFFTLKFWSCPFSPFNIPNPQWIFFRRNEYYMLFPGIYFGSTTEVFFFLYIPTLRPISKTHCQTHKMENFCLRFIFICIS